LTTSRRVTGSVLARVLVLAIGLGLGLTGCIGGAGAGGRPADGEASPTASFSDGGPSGTLDIPIPTLGASVIHVPTRVRIAELGIDLPVVAPPADPNAFPYCDVAEYLPTLATPGEPGTTFVFAHARSGMFLPLLVRSEVNDGASLVGLQVEIYTDDDLLFTYQVTQVVRHVTSLDFAYRSTEEQVMLQTSEGPRTTVQKLVVIGRPTGASQVSASEAHPAARPRVCE
jgi:hypothetical protein